MAAVSFCSDVVADGHSFVSSTVVGAGDARLVCPQSGVPARSGCRMLCSCVSSWQEDGKRASWNLFVRAPVPSQGLPFEASSPANTISLDDGIQQKGFWRPTDKL